MKKETLSVRFLYHTHLGRLVLKGLVRPGVSRVAGRYLSSPYSRWLVGAYVKKNAIDLSAYPKREYRSFNDFFTRTRPLEQVDPDENHLLSPCDAYLSVHPVDESSVYHIKHMDYDLARLLGDEALARRYAGGQCLIFRLTPRHYHRYGFFCGGKVLEQRRIDGKLHCVRPVAYTTVPVFGENSREYVLLENERLGNVVQMEVGALLVGKICNHPTGEQVRRLTEKGYFEFGGSTIIVLLEKGKAQLCDRFSATEEVEVTMGEEIGRGMN